MASISLAATWEQVEMMPSAPKPKNDSMAESSPDKTAKSGRWGLIKAIMWVSFSQEGLASLMPTMLGCSKASLATVSAAISTPVLTATLYKMMGSDELLAIAEKWA